MPVQIHGKTYVTVAERVQAAHAADVASITTELLGAGDGERYIVRAHVALKDGREFTGHAEEIRGSAGIAGKSPLEVAETSAVGRALGFAGFGSMESIASAGEVQRATPQDAPGRPPAGKTSKNAAVAHPASAVKAGLVKKAQEFSHYRPPSANQLGLMNGLLSKILGGDKERRSWIDWQWSFSSSKQMSGNHVGATLDWLKPEKDPETDQYIPLATAVEEAKLMLRQAMIDKGQQEFEMPAEPEAPRTPATPRLVAAADRNDPGFAIWPPRDAPAPTELLSTTNLKNFGELGMAVLANLKLNKTQALALVGVNEFIEVDGTTLRDKYNTIVCAVRDQ